MARGYEHESQMDYDRMLAAGRVKIILQFNKFINQNTEPGRPQLQAKQAASAAAEKKAGGKGGAKAPRAMGRGKR